MSLLTNVLKLWRTGQYLLPADSGFMVKHLFANGEPGFAKLDFSGFAGMYQDRARTIPYTAVEQPLGSFTGLNGVTATAPADVNRGVVSARVNLLTNTGFSGAVAGTPGTPPTGWAFLANLGETVSVNADGSGGYVWRVKATNNRHFVSQYSAEITANSVWDLTVKLGFVSGVSAIANLFTTNGLPSGASVVYYINNTAVAGSAVPVSGDTLTNRVTTAGAGGTVAVRVGVGCSSNGTGEVEFSKLSLTLATDAHLPYQRVNTATDYDTVGFPHYLKFNGTNTAYVTPSIDFTGTDKMTVWAGVTKLSDAGTQMVAELSPTVNAYPGFYLAAPRSNGEKSIAFRQSGTLYGSAIEYTSAVPPFSAVVSAGGDISAGTIFINVNGVRQTAAGNQGTGNHGNYPLYIGARAGTSYFFNGRLYSLIVRGAQSSLSQIEATENLIRKTMRLP